ncbi:MAG: hypothetical protein NTX75_16005 [Proteobacteria bacterium]|nr:hypothetical protein [Pseudomonadota bacterium]
MKKRIYGIIGLVFLLGALMPLGEIKETAAQVQVDINIGPPPIVVAAPPAVVMVPRSKVYFVPDPHIDVFFYNGYWWSPRGNQWYRSRAYKGPWGVVERRYVPAPVHRVPRDYRVVYEKEKHIPYGQWKKQWKNQAKAERKEDKREQKENKKEQKQGGGHGQGQGQGHGQGKN